MCGTDSLDAKVLQVQAAFDPSVKSLNPPTAPVDFAKTFCRVSLLIQKRSGQYLQFSSLKAQRHKAHAQFHRQTQSLKFGALLDGRSQLYRQTYTGLVFLNQLSHHREGAARTAADKLPALHTVHKPSVAGIAPISDYQIVGLHQIQMPPSQFSVSLRRSGQLSFQGQVVEQIV